MSTIRVKAAVVDTKKLILYKEDGKTITIPQGDPRIKSLVDQIVPIVNAGEIAEVDLKTENQYRAFEEAQPKEGGGIVRFFRTARNKLGGLFKTEEEEELPTGVFGEIPVLDNLNEAIEQILAHAVPVGESGISDVGTEPDADETIIAVVDNADGETKIIPGVEALKDILEHSAKHRNTIGVQNLLKRMAGYITSRQHSVEDLLRFLEKGDLPIADDGSIIAYKRLYTTDKEGVFVDPHTKKVTQKVGSKVQVSEELVDKNRRNECSNGLHIGRRAYMGSFSGNVMVLCKIAPEDVIVVPHRDPNKVRVSAYHILARLPDKAFQQINSNKPMTDIAGLSDLLGKVLKGNHIPVLETVEITEQQGGGLVITPTGAVRKLGGNRLKDKHDAATAIDDKRNVKPKQEASNVDPKALIGSTSGSRQARAAKLLNIVTTSTDAQHRISAAKDLIAFKKKVKIGWPVLGLTKEQVTMVINVAETPIKAPLKPKAPKKPAKAKTRSTAAPRASKSVKREPRLSRVAPVKPGKTPFAEKPIQKPEPVPASKPLSKYQQLRQLADQLDTGHLSPAQEAIIAQQLLDARKASKKSWEALGFPDLSDLQLRRIIESPLAAQMPKGNYGKNGDQDHLGAVNEMLADNAKQARDEDALSPERKAALALVRGGMSVSAASKKTGVHRRTIDRDVEKYGK